MFHIEFMGSTTNHKSTSQKYSGKSKFLIGEISPLQNSTKSKILALNWKDNSVESNIVQIISSKQKILGKEFKQTCHTKFGVCTIETKLVIYLLQGHLEMIIIKLLELL